MMFPGFNRDGYIDSDDDDTLAMIRLPKKKKTTGGDSGFD